MVVLFRDWRELLLARGQSRQGWNPKQALLGRDRRVFERVAMDLSCTLENKLYGQKTPATLINVSLGGVGLHGTVTWPEGSQILVTMDGVPLEGVVVFRRSAPDGDPKLSHYGIKFQKMHFKDLMHVRRLLRRHYRGPLSVL